MAEKVNGIFTQNIIKFSTMIRKFIPHPIRKILGRIYYGYLIICWAKIKWYLFGIKINDPKQVPIIINNYNRLESLLKLIQSLKVRGYNNIYIIDNNSTYPPLLEFYNNTDVSIIRLDRNVGYMSIWDTDVYDQFKRSYYVYSDSDMEIDEECPDDFMQRFIDILGKYKLSHKVGFGIRIDDLPDSYCFKQDVINHESQFWRNEVASGIYNAMIDTTFALYRPYCKGAANSYYDVYRTGFPYVIKHLPWYQDSSNLSDEDKYYKKHISTPTHWSKQ